MEAKIQKWGNSLGVRIPMSIVKDLSLENGSAVEVIKENDNIVIKPLLKVNVSDLIDQISDDNLHSEVDWGTPEGNEIW